MTLLATNATLAGPSTKSAVEVRIVEHHDEAGRYLAGHGYDGFLRDPRWLNVLQSSLAHRPLLLQAEREGRVVGVLPLVLVESLLFGRFLVGLPYVNTGGPIGDDEEVITALVDRAVELATELRAKHLELRCEIPIEHSSLTHRLETKVHSRLRLEATPDGQWDALKSKVRSQIRKPLKNESLTVHWGTHELLADFYRVFCRNMRDLGSPVFPKSLFASILSSFPDEAELCCVRCDGRPAAAALLLHGPGVTQVPSASTVREFNSAGVNMLMYWRLLERAIERGQTTFDFGRSTIDGGTHRFKKQWGAVDDPAVWQYHVLEGDPTGMRRESGKFGLAVRVWQRLPVWATKIVGPKIVRGIP